MTTAIAPPCDETQPPSEHRTRCPSEAGTLIATITGSALAFVAGSIINVALPAMRAEFGTDAAAVQWIVNSYLLPLGAFVLVAGALGDHYGRKRIFLSGVALFAAASLACALAPSLAALYIARFVLGIAAALIAPNSLAIIADAFTGEARGKAIGTWAGIGALAGAVAPLAGGIVVDQLDWRWAFAIVVPPAALAGLVGWRSIAESREDADERRALDGLGAALATLSLAAFVYALIAAPDRRPGDPRVLASAAFGLVSGAAFLWLQARRKTEAMLPLGLFGANSFTGISLLTFLLYAALGGLLVVLPYMLIEDFGYSATMAGAAIMPFPLIMGVLSRYAGGFAHRIGIRRALTLGSLVVAIGFTLFALRADPEMSYWTGILPGLLIMALGMAVTVAPLTTAVINAVANEYTGVASGVNNAIARIAGLMATAMLGPVLAGASLVSGFQFAAWIAAGSAAAGSIIAFVMIRESEVRGVDP